MKKFYKIWGVGLALLLLVSMLLAAVPVAAGTNSLSAKTGSAIPSGTDKFLVDGGEYADMAVSPDGETIYVVDVGNDGIFKSTNGGDTFSGVTPPSDLESPEMIAVAPDNPDVVVVFGDGAEAYVSTNGGSSWSDMTAPAMAPVNDLAIAAMDGATRYVALATDAEVYYFNLGATAPSWKDAATWDGPPAGSFTSVAFSPNFPSDQIMLLVTDNGSAVSYNVASFNQKAWDDEIFTGYPIEVASYAGTLNATDIAVDPEYLGGDESLRTVFIGVAFNDNDGGIYRFKDTSKKELKDDTAINSVAWDGTNLAAGAYDTNNVYRSADALASSPTVSTSRSYKEIGVDDAGVDAVIVRWAGDMLAGVKQGDAASFATSDTNGQTWIEKGLINDVLDPMDFQIAYDESVQYLLSENSGVISLYRSASPWTRVFVAEETDTDWIVRIAMNDPDVVYLADREDKKMFYTTGGGLDKWTQRNSRYAVQDLAVQDEDVAYVANYENDEVSKTTNGGFTWGTDVDTKSGGGESWSLALISPDNLVFGTNDGYVSYSTDGNASWTKISTQLYNADNGYVQVTASGLDNGDYIFATNDEGGRIERWEIGQSGDTWKNMAAPEGPYYGLVFDDGVLYGMRVDGGDSMLERNISPFSSTPSSGHWACDTEEDVYLDAAPRSFWVSRNSEGQPNIWAINTDGSGDTSLYSANDIIAPGADPLSISSPTANQIIPMNPVRGIAEDVLVQWSKPGSGTYVYNVKITTDEAGNVTVNGGNYESASTDSSTVRVLIGPNQNPDDNQFVSFNPGAKYYAWVRVAEPWYSVWAGPVAFQIGTLAAAAPEILSPQVGADDISTRPAFSWSPTAGATSYKFQLALNPEMSKPIVDVAVASTGYRLLEALDRETTYYWRVMAVAPVEGDWSAVANFMVAAEAAEAPAPITITQIPPPEIVLPAPTINLPAPQEIVIPPAPAAVQIVPVYIYVIIGIGAILVIVVIILIVRTRKPM